MPANFNLTISIFAQTFLSYWMFRKFSFSREIPFCTKLNYPSFHHIQFRSSLHLKNTTWAWTLFQTRSPNICPYCKIWVCILEVAFLFDLFATPLSKIQLWLVHHKFIMFFTQFSRYFVVKKNKNVILFVFLYSYFCTTVKNSGDT